MNSLELMLRELRLGPVVRPAQEVAIRAERRLELYPLFSHD
jgi:hypothetical protein